MKILIINAEEVEIPEEMVQNFIKLLQLRIESIPTIGEEIEILYSEKDPLMDKGLWNTDDEAFTVYFSVVDIEPKNSENLENTKISVALNF